MSIDEGKRRRRGPKPLDEEVKRTHTVSVRLNAAELERLDQLRESAQLRRGEYLRAASLHKPPASIPEVNREAWRELARLAANLNQYQAAANEGKARGDAFEIGELRELVERLRRELIGAEP